MASIVSFRIDKKLKSRMDRLRHINWSELLRKYLQKVVEEEEKKLRTVRDPEAMQRAVEVMETLAKISEGSGWVGEEEVIKWRRRRFSYLTQV